MLSIRKAAGTALAATLLAAATPALAQKPAGLPGNYPSKPIRWLVPSAAGGAFDILTRALAPVMTQNMGQAFVVDNRAGAAGVLGMEMGAKAAPDVPRTKRTSRTWCLMCARGFCTRRRTTASACCAPSR